MKGEPFTKDHYPSPSLEFQGALGNSGQAHLSDLAPGSGTAAHTALGGPAKSSCFYDGKHNSCFHRCRAATHEKSVPPEKIQCLFNI